MYVYDRLQVYDLCVRVGRRFSGRSSIGHVPCTGPPECSSIVLFSALHYRGILLII
ncbi:hypothetical protein M758_10G034400 [Ceratodon purpureus]|nr:hypothetical protein M758_10G034400 [Ceratodon purpureus]